MVTDYQRVISKINPVYKPLMSPHLTKLDTAVEPGLHMLTWTSLNINTYFESIYESLKDLELLIGRANQIIEYRILKVLKEITDVPLCELPTCTPWTVEFFYERTKVFSRAYFWKSSWKCLY